MGIFDKLRTGLSKTRNVLTMNVEDIFSSRGITDETLDEFEELLITSDIGVKATVEIIEAIRKKAEKKEIKNYEELKAFLKSCLKSMLGPPQPFVLYGERPFVVLTLGVNGVGKTTTIGKIASKLISEGHMTIMAAADTFRAAAIEQLEIWAERSGAQIIKHQGGSDPAAVAFDAVQAAQARGIDCVLVDTAGRLHTKSPLMEELKKVKRVINKAMEGAPHETLLVVDATTGQNALRQARMFHEAIGISAIVLTKLDGTAKGGIVIAIKKELNIPVRLVGVGEGIDDLIDFNPEDFVDALF
ncbi:MAG TPA: signal recognition particle-docking protein FtsY [Nitrospirae bacterium]|nr:signal recognition particle-docking protein FtsY [Nitrospirota bacterium]HDO23280.1 signal recognition particle-docking protein FtsY [Nitrospirota bacterium]HDZ88338.1 signal recognition particle-docking protein FtsY [Nitrospirota bacterium]